MRNLFVLLLFHCTLFSLGQEVQKHYHSDLNTLKNEFYLMDSIQKNRFSTAYLAKAKLENTTVKIANGYYLLSELNIHKKAALQYSDSIIQLTKNTQNKNYPALGYIQKGIHYYYNGQNELALENFLQANQLAVKNENRIQLVIVKHYVGLLKSVNNKIEEALSIFKENYQYLKENQLDTTYKKQYFKSLFALANGYAKNKLFDQAIQYYNKGLKESKNNPDFYYPYFLTGHGVCSFEKGAYQQSIDSLQKGCKLLKEDPSNLAAMYLYIYDAYKGMGTPDQGIHYLNSIDSVYKQDNSIRRYSRIAYGHLNDYYKHSKNKKKQLTYLTKLVEVDSLIKAKDGNLYVDIVKNYDTPELLKAKQELINSLEEQNSSKQYNIFILIALCTIFSGLFIFFSRRSYVLNKRFDLLMEEQNNKETQVTPPVITASKVESLGLSEELVTQILTKLEKFESSLKFVKKKYTLNTLAKELNTNSSYLSKVINLEKNSNFSNYLNNLKIDYAIQRLNQDPKFRKYTIKAISEECGFSSQQTFSTAFFKKTKLKPSFFIKKITNSEPED
ncbi:Transcriptional regulator, AraC/XylS family protein [Tenacibaculum litopenaei]